MTLSESPYNKPLKPTANCIIHKVGLFLRLFEIHGDMCLSLKQINALFSKDESTKSFISLSGLCYMHHLIPNQRFLKSNQHLKNKIYPVH